MLAAMKATNLHGILGSIVAATLASACGGSSEEGTPGGLGGAPATMECIDTAPALTRGLNTPQPFDYLGVYQGQSGSDPTLLESSGTECGGASDATVCAAAVAEARPDCYLTSATNCAENGLRIAAQSISYHYLVRTQGDDVQDISTKDALLSLLGSVDTPNEAALVLWAQGQDIDCNAVYADGSGKFVTDADVMTSDCPFTWQLHRITVSPDGSVAMKPIAEPKVGSSCAGRRPEGLAACEGSEGSELGRYFAGLYHLETAAVVAFALLERELVAHGAPRSLIERARRARAEEVHHSRIMLELAKRFGGALEPVRVELRPVRPLLEIALENVVEGCVRETYGAACAHFQARRATDPEVRAAMSVIATDETSHAELSADLDVWLREQLSAGELTQLEEARERAVAELDADLARDLQPAINSVAGMPTAAQAASLMQGLRRALWAA